MASALLELAQTGQTSDQKLAAVFTARDINRLCGGVVVTPWTIYETLNDEWLDIFEMMSQDLPVMQAGQQRVEEIHDKWRKEQGFSPAH